MLRRPFLRLQKFAAAALLAVAAGGAFAQSAPNYTGTYGVEDEPGWGLLATHQGEVLAFAWYSYASDGKPVWFTAVTQRQGDGSYAGAVNRFEGLPFGQIDGTPAFTTATAIGTATARPAPDGALDFGWRIDGVERVERVRRLEFAADETVCEFATGSRADATNYTDLWWNPAESGWGLNIDHQGDALYLAWYTYGSDSRALWMIAAPLQKQPDGSFTGNVVRAAAGTPYAEIAGAPATSFPLPTVGTATVRFTDGERGSFTYTVDGITRTRPIERLVFASPPSVCRAADDTPPAGAKCKAPLLDGDTVTLRSRSTSGGQTAEAVVTEVVRGTRTFDGRALRYLEQLDAQNRLQARIYFALDEDTVTYFGGETYNPANGELVGVTRYNPTPSFRREPQLGVEESRSYVAVSTTFGTTTSVNVTERLKLVGYESVTVPAGTFADACKIENEIRTVHPLYTSITTGVSWGSRLVGQLRAEFTSTAAGATAQGTTELLSARVAGISYPD